MVNSMFVIAPKEKSAEEKGERISRLHLFA
uniref:Uncharacterized protein n=1 Tax=Arundo donax TaxID=35708 RepID=A0A0A8ZPM8_ARUDO